MTRIWWCQEHDEHAATKSIGDQWCWRANFTPPQRPCRMVPMRLIPDDAETVERIALIMLKADYGESATPQMSGAIEEEFNVHHLPIASRILAALDGETP